MLTPGTRLGVYEVTTQIGAGGMGEVYRATDSNLKRSVAIKVLPASVAGDADRLARFQREAEVLAALNHPNIGAIYGLEKRPDFTALVMELVLAHSVQRILRATVFVESRKFSLHQPGKTWQLGSHGSGDLSSLPYIHSFVKGDRDRYGPKGG